ncbi:class I adenylate-forming enzyme family protein [Sphingomonas sp. TX0543]|uniref:class I adenylate-forming enzyme family protein n=1 Tax=Sphingomonas sp. TX0543 TaxID=3399682 RepID=UPI003AFA3C23
MNAAPTSSEPRTETSDGSIQALIDRGLQPSPEVTGGVGRLALGDLLRRSARRFRNKVAIIEPSRHITFGELDDAANRCANMLLAQGAKPGDRIATICSNSIDFVIVIFGIHKAGLVWVPINPLLAGDDRAFILNHTEASVVIADETVGHVVPQGTERMPVVLTLGASFNERLASASNLEPDLSIHERDLTMIMYTSGTTSRPKGVMHCNLAVYATVMCNIGEWYVTRSDRILIVLPMFHVSAHCLFTTFMAAGATVVLHNGFDAGRVLTAIEEQKVSFFVGLPMMYAAMMDHTACAETDLSSLRYCIYAMAPMPKPLLRRLLSDFCPTFVLSSGQTEMYPSTAMLRPEQQLLKEGNYWGEPSIVNDMAIMDDDGTLLPRGEVGEIVHRGPNVMLGYYKDEAATAHSRRFGWHHTGDLGVIDDDGQLLFVDRLKDIIKSGGENVASVKVEQILLQHPSIANAAAIGVPHPRWQEAVVGVVMLKPGCSAEAADILSHCRQALAPHEVPKAVQFVDDLPLTATSKLRKVELRDRFIDLFGG